MNEAWSYEVAFSRHRGIITPDEQEQLRQCRIAIVGMGGVGGIHLVTLGRLGIGKFTIADLDWFETANFNRQYGARIDNIGRPKAEVMAAEIRQINPEVELRVFDAGIQEDTVTDFLEGADLFVDGIDFFAIELRRHLFREAASKGIFGITAAPLGFGTAWLAFDPFGMTFDDYFDFSDSQTELEQVVAMAVGLAPEALHGPYFDWGAVDLGERRGPSSGLACQLCAGVVAAEAIKVLLKREKVRCAPAFSQFDPYRGRFETACIPEGNQHPSQQKKRSLLLERIGELLEALPSKTEDRA